MLRQMYPSGNEIPIDSHFSGVGPRSVTLSRKPTADQVAEEILKFFISGNIPFNQAGNPHFHKLLKYIVTVSGEAVTTSRKKVRSQLASEAMAADADLHELFKRVESKISLALDNWTSRNGYAFMGMFPSLLWM